MRTPLLRMQWLCHRRFAERTPLRIAAPPTFWGITVCWGKHGWIRRFLGPNQRA